MKKVALITGASSGIGKEFARIHAEKGGDLIIVARRENKLEELKKELEKKHSITVATIVCDLSIPNSAVEVYNKTKELGLEVDYLINNAGFGQRGKFHELSWERHHQMMQLNMISLSQLTHLFLPEFVKRNSGKILNSSSTASFMPGPLQAVYFATKSYVTFLSNALSEELAETEITVTNLMPGATETEFAASSDMDKTELFNKTFSAKSVAEDGYNGMLKGKLDVVSGLTFGQKMMMSMIPLTPKKVLLKQVKKCSKPQSKILFDNLKQNYIPMKKVIIVTGASSGIGKETAHQLIKEGHTVYGLARRLENMKDLIDAGGDALQMDVTDHDQIKAVIGQIIEKESKVDVLVNNAGYALYGPIEEVTYEQAKRQFDVNIFGLAEVTKAVLPVMRKHKSGLIINVSSVGGKIYSPLGAWYHATKHALEGWSDCLRLELKQFGINVSVIEPGAIKTEFDVAMDHQFGDLDSPYGELKTKMEKVMENAYKPGNYSEPTVIAETISKAINTAHPKTRYAAGKMAKQTLMGRKFLSDKGFDKMIMNMVNRFAKNN